MRTFVGTVRKWRAMSAGIAGAVVLVSAVLIYIGLSAATDPTATVPDTTPTATATRTKSPSPTPLLSPTPTPVQLGSILNGALMTEEEWNARKDLLPVAVMIDNTPGSVPHIGLEQADVVYEAFVEGGITRFMAVYWSRESHHIEPVRSARTPFVVWADELGAMYGHAGSADTDNDADAGGQIEDWGVMDLNAFTPGPGTAYYRDNGRVAPYNLVTATHWLREAGDRLGYAGPPRLEPWLFKAAGAGTAELPVTGGIQIVFHERWRAWQTVQWKWDDSSTSYLRFQYGGPFIDAGSQEQIRATNLVIMSVPWRVVDESGHVLLDQFGDGNATVYLDGKAIEGTWRKDDRQGRTRFYDTSGGEIAFNRGPIWIEVIGPGSPVLGTKSAADLPELPPYTLPGR